MTKAKGRTTMSPQDITKYISIFEAPMVKTEDLDFGLGWIWKGDVTGNDGDKSQIAVMARFEIKGKHGKLFDYILSRASTNETDLIKFNVKEFLEEAGRSTDYQTRKRTIKDMMQLQTLTVGIKKNRGKYRQHTLIMDVDGDVSTGEVTVLLHPQIQQYFEINKKRYVNLSQTLPIKSALASEFAKFLQIKGQGGNGHGAKPVNSFVFDDAVQYLHWGNRSEKSCLDGIGQLLRQLEEVGYPKYRRIKNEQDRFKWVKIHG